MPLGEIADVAVREAPEMIRNDNGDLAGYVYVYLDAVTAPEYVERAQEYLRTRLTMPPGYSMEWTGLYQYTEDARSTLRIVVPITLAIMFALLVMAFRSIADSSLIMLSAPFALVGGVLLQWYLGYSMTTAVIIGYVSLFAVAIQTGIIMIEFIREALVTANGPQSYMEAVVEGSVTRLRPKLMTVATTVFGLLPIMFASGSGMDITKPIATPTFGGMITSTIYVLFLIPCLFAIGEDIRRRWPERFGVSLPSRLSEKNRDEPSVSTKPHARGYSSRVSRPSACSTSEVPPAVTQGTTTGEGMDIGFRSESAPPTAGDNLFEVTVTKDGAPVSDATVTAVFSMPAMPSMNMPEMRSTATLAPDGEGRYRGTGRLSMAGTWNVRVTVTRDSKELGTKSLSIVAK